MNPAYRQVRFRVDPPEMKTPDSFAIITAWNPDGRPTALENNQEANDRFQSRLDKAGLYWFSVTGGSPDFAHVEPGFGVSGITRNEAVALGRNFRQEAIYWVEGGAVFLISCQDPALEEIGLWNDLVLLAEC